jgi:hypothetical protein
MAKTRSIDLRQRVIVAIDAGAISDPHHSRLKRARHMVLSRIEGMVPRTQQEKAMTNNKNEELKLNELELVAGGGFFTDLVVGLTTGVAGAAVKGLSDAAKSGGSSAGGYHWGTPS